MKVWLDQVWHILVIVLLLFGLKYIVSIDNEILSGELWGLSTRFWMILAILSPIIHQIYVVVFWRIELYYKGMTKAFGVNAFKIFKVFFAILILSRPVTIILLAISNAMTIQLGTPLSICLSIILLIPAIYLFYSIKKYFGMDRAFGLDHFQPEKVKKIPFVRLGIFKYTPNAMYVFGFFLLWVPGVLGQSKSALLLALFNHLFIWGHFFFTELPDMNHIYKTNKE